MRPASSRPIISSVVATGRRMNGSEMLDRTSAGSFAISCATLPTFFGLPSSPPPWPS